MEVIKGGLQGTPIPIGLKEVLVSVRADVSVTVSGLCGLGHGILSSNQIKFGTCKDTLVVGKYSTSVGKRQGSEDSVTTWDMRADKGLSDRTGHCH